MVLIEIGALPTCFGLRLLTYAIQLPGTRARFGGNFGSVAASATSTRASSLPPFLRQSIIRGRSYRYTTAPLPKTFLEMTNLQPESAHAAETTYVNDCRIVHIATRQAFPWDEQQQEQQSGSSELTWTICDVIASQAAVSVRRAIELVRSGAVYIGEEVANGGGRMKSSTKKVAFTPNRHPRDGDESVGAVRKGAAMSESQKRKINSKSAEEPPFVGTSFVHMRLRRLDGSEALSPPTSGTYLRVHCDPQTFPSARATDWKERLVAVTEDYVVVDKPAGVPSVPTIDNAVENALHQTGLVLSSTYSPSHFNYGDDYDEKKLLLPSPPPPRLHAASRLDVCTSGLIVFARNKSAASTLNSLFRDRRVSKRYLALLTPGPPLSLGPVVHCCRSKAFDGRGRPRVYANYDAELLREGSGKWGGAWIEARSNVLLCAPVTGRAVTEAVARDRLEEEAVGELTGSAKLEAESEAGAEVATCRGEEREHRNDPPHLCVLELDTGRTHQLRLQLAAMGAAIVGDTRYRRVIGRIHRGISADDQTDMFGPEPEAIALQAARLEFDWRGKRFVYSAKRPPWATELKDATLHSGPL